ncbi:hypothetical protein ACPB9J_13715 [Streptomyces lavendulocolor]|uniref:hypothetical protein n=1 Tax=Streptomyces lavendulocolor TaxID=67316 RepID=UPI003C2DAD50
MSLSLSRSVGLCAAALAVAVCPMLPATAAPTATALAAASRADVPGLPPIGAEVPVSMLALGSTFEYGGTTYSLDFQGGTKQRVEPNNDNPTTSVRLRTLGFQVMAQADDGSSITLELSGADTEAASTLTLTQQFPPIIEERDVISITATITRPGQEPVTLDSKDPMVLLARHLRAYPPQREIYQLQQPVELADRAGHTAATLWHFPAMRGYL